MEDNAVCSACYTTAVDLPGFARIRYGTPLPRPPGWLLSGAETALVRQDEVQLDARGRIQLPRRVLDPLGWAWGRRVECLSILEERGRVRLLPWAEASPPVMERRDDLLARGL